MRKAAIRALMTRAAGGGRALDKGGELVNQATASASEFLRTRRDPASIAERKRRAARRRVTAWSAVAVIGAALEAYEITTMTSKGVDGGGIAAAILFGAILVWGVVNLVRAAGDLRARSKVVRSLPAPQPVRRPVAAPVRGLMNQLDGYSDGLRHLISMVGVSREGGVRELRDDTLAAADLAEQRLRDQAQEYTGLLRTRSNAPAAARSGLGGTADQLLGEIERGVAAYGELVTATTETVAASRDLAAGLPGTDVELRDRSDQLRALAAGMRELTHG
jgi:hypothetical protein